MLTVTDRVRDWITAHPFHAVFLENGLINNSSLARKIRPEIEAQAGERLSVESITLAINRYSKSISSDITIDDYDSYLGEVSVQSGLGILTIPQVDLDSDAFFHAVAKLHQQREYTIYTRGIWHTALIGRQEIIGDLAAHFHGTITSRDLIGVTIKLKPGHLPVPGVCAYILQKLAFEGVNLQEVTSSHNELTVIIDKEDTNRALSCLV